VVTGEVAGLTAVAAVLLPLATDVLLFVPNFFCINIPANAALGLFSTLTIPFFGLGCNNFCDDDIVEDSKVVFVV